MTIKGYYSMTIHSLKLVYSVTDLSAHSPPDIPARFQATDAPSVPQQHPRAAEATGQGSVYRYGPAFAPDGGKDAAPGERGGGRPFSSD